jgi:hypothetical protein
MTTVIPNFSKQQKILFSRVSKQRKTKKMRNKMKQNKKDANQNSKLARLMETKRKQVSLRQFFFHEPLTTIQNKTEHVGSDPFSHVILFAANMRKRVIFLVFCFVQNGCDGFMKAKLPPSQLISHLFRFVRFVLLLFRFILFKNLLFIF